MNGEEMEELKAGWKKVNLGDIIKVQKGYAFKSKDFLNKGIKIIKVSNLENETINFLDCACISEENFEKYKKYALNYKDIIITTVGSWPNNKNSVVGKVVRVPQVNEKLLLNQNAIRVTALEKYLQEYIYYALKDSKFKYYIEGVAQGSANQASITLEDIKEYELKIPSLKVQKKIVSILASLDEKIELNRKINQNLEETAQTLFKRWFIDFEFPNEEGKPYKSSGGKMIESELGEIPEGWRVGKLGDFIKFIKGKKPKILVEKEDEINKFKYLTIKSINNEEENYCSEEKVIFVSKNEIMMVMDGASSGDIYIGKEGILGSTLSKIEIEKSIDWSIIYCLLNYYKNEIKQHNTGSAIPHTDKNYIENITFFLPNNGKINYFSKIFKRILLKKIVLEDEVYKLIELRDYLLPRLMSGEISV